MYELELLELQINRDIAVLKKEEDIFLDKANDPKFELFREIQKSEKEMEKLNHIKEYIQDFIQSQKDWIDKINND